MAVGETKPFVHHQSIYSSVARFGDAARDYPIIDLSPCGAPPGDFDGLDLSRIRPRFSTRNHAGVGDIGAEIYGLTRSRLGKKAPLAVVDSRSAEQRK